MNLSGRLPGINPVSLLCVITGFSDRTHMRKAQPCAYGVRYIFPMFNAPVEDNFLQPWPYSNWRRQSAGDWFYDLCLGLNGAEPILVWME